MILIKERTYAALRSIVDEIPGEVLPKKELITTALLRCERHPGAGIRLKAKTKI